VQFIHTKISSRCISLLMTKICNQNGVLLKGLTR
jgi:hypothetical protein